MCWPRGGAAADRSVTVDVPLSKRYDVGVERRQFCSWCTRRRNTVGNSQWILGDKLRIWKATVKGKIQWNFSRIQFFEDFVGNNTKLRRILTEIYSNLQFANFNICLPRAKRSEILMCSGRDSKKMKMATALDKKEMSNSQTGYLLTL